MTRLHVEIEDFVAAARTMSTTIAEPSHRAASMLGGSLDDCGSMAGNDPGGQSWASDYDEAAWTVLQATSQTVNAMYQTACLFAVSAVNHAQAESASTPVGSSSPGTTALLESLPDSRVVDDPPRPPTTNGSSGDDGPTGWWIVEHSVGYVWPNGDSDRLRQAADAWDESAGALSTNTCLISRVTTPFTSDHLPEADDINTVCNGLGTRLAELAHAHWSLAHACREYAAHLDTCHDDVVNELTWLLGETATLQVAGAILSGFSFGAAEIPTQAAQGLRVALSAERITHYIQTFLEAVTVTRTSIATTAKIAYDVQRDLTTLADARLAYATIKGVPGAVRASTIAREGREAIATGKLAQSEARLGKLPEALANIGRASKAEWGDARTLADHYTRHGPGVGASSAEDYARRASDFLRCALHGEYEMKISPGAIRVWDRATHTFASYRPDGATRTFYHVKSSTYFDRQPGEPI